ncbi:MAG: sporulation protein YqfD [Bacilli bacterium]
MKNKIIIEYYSIDVLLKILYENNIEASSIIYIDEYHISICVDDKDLRKIRKLNLHFIKKRESYFQKFISIFSKEKLLVFSLIISIFYFASLKSKIANVFILGSSQEINENIKNDLKNEGIYKSYPLKSIDELSLIQKKYLLIYQDKITTLSISLKGNNIYINYVVKPKPIVLESLHGKMFSKYNAVVKTINISSGHVLVKTNQFVQAGQLIVDDEIMDKNKSTYLGTKGKIFGYVYFEITKSSPIGNNPIDAFEINLLDARYEILKDMEEGEELLEEKILSSTFENDVHTLKICFLTIKNIVSF